MQLYANRGGNSSVVPFEIGADAISIQFQGGALICTTTVCPERPLLEQMKTLAIEGMGLGSYGNRHVRKAYAAGLR